jgi:hypothetical protein
MEKHEEKLDQNFAPQAAQRKVYEKPRLEEIGDVRSLTLGSSIGLGESGGMYDPKTMR